eukprot:scaffold7190_cov193-Amphora_coffeaeformis.AAC.6
MTVKYITVNGVRKLNPAWKAERATPPFQNRITALPVVSYPSQEGLFAPGEEEIVIAPSYTQAVNQYQTIVVEAKAVAPEPEIAVAGQGNHHGLGPLGEVLQRYEVPAGMLTKLLGLKDFQAAEIMVDDSSSMNAATDALGPNGETQTRWQEAKMRILQMMELVAYVKAPKFDVRFLNRNTLLEIERQPGEAPQVFFQRCKDMLEREFYTGPSGTTPALERIRESLGRYQGHQSCLRYFMGDGEPNGGAYSCKQIEELLLHRPNPERNPFTFMSCTNDDSATEWMKDAEEIAPYCSEFDDYLDESREVLRDQGKAFPYSYGLHLVAQLVAAFNPDDLDAMDESVPFTKQTMDDLLGYQTSQQEYKYYFDSFLEAQRLLPLKPHQRSFVGSLPRLFSQFVEVSRAADIPAVSEYRLQAKSITQKSRQLQQPPQDECCVIL